MNNYFNHSGGAEGADMEWDRIGREYGFENHKHYRPADLKNAPPEHRIQLEQDIFDAALGLGRPTSEFPGKDFVRRNWFQANGADAIYAISRIIKPGAFDKGFPNKTGKEIVSGGTAWACELAIQKDKPVHVFDMSENAWFVWNGKNFQLEFIPILTLNYAGIGSRNLTEMAKIAIRDVYLKTLNQQHDRGTVNSDSQAIKAQ